MERERANRIIFAIIELASVAEGINKTEMYPNNQYIVRLDKLIESPDYREFKSWLEGKK